MQKEIISLLFHYARPYRIRVSLLAFNSALTVFIGAFIGPLFIASILESIQRGDATVSGLIVPIAYYAATQLYGEMIGWRINLYLIWTFEASAQKELYRSIFNKLANESLAFHADRFGGSLVSQTNKLTGSFERFWDTIILSI